MDRGDAKSVIHMDSKLLILPGERMAMDLRYLDSSHVSLAVLLVAGKHADYVH